MSHVASDDIADLTRQASNVLTRHDYRHDITGRMHTYFMDAFFLQLHQNSTDAYKQDMVAALPKNDSWETYGLV